MVGVIWAATMVPPFSGDPADLVDRIDGALAHLEQGLPL
jgi:hypothetical protein